MKIIKGNIAVLEHDTHISKWVEQHGSLIHNKWLYHNLSAYINKESVVLEGGAFIGDNTAFLSKLASKVISFEPNKEAFDCLKHNFNDVENVTIHNLGLSDKQEKAGIVRDNNAGASFLSDGDDIELVTIDEFKLQKLDFIILDCEGFEYKILKGGEKTIRKFKPVMLIEINNGHLVRNNTSDNDLFVYLTELGYEFKNLDSKKSIYEEQLDLICIPK
jgi:FkbM family methyltransferase